MRHDLVLDPQDEDQVVMAHRFASVPLGFSVMGTRTLWWGDCAWDSFALPHLLKDEPDVLFATRCPACYTPYAWVVGRYAPPKGDQAVVSTRIGGREGGGGKRAVDGTAGPPPGGVPDHRPVAQTGRTIRCQEYFRMARCNVTSEAISPGSAPMTSLV
nr:organomercurial lyase [Streptomyces sp. GMR22]